MSVAFFPGQVLGETDLKIDIRDSSGILKDPSIITYSIFDSTTGLDVLMGGQDQVPQKNGVGQYWVNFQIPLDANIGDWLVRWNFRENPGSPIIQVVQEFAVVAKQNCVVHPGAAYATPTQQVPAREATLLRRLRILLRDNNPDRNYRFRPPNTDQFLQSQTEVFGYIWTDEELYEYLLMAIDDLNAAPPVTGVNLQTLPDRWRTAVIIRAASFAAMAITMNWIADEFDYSISGVSLSIEKSSKYQGMKDNFEQQYDKLKEEIKRSIKIIKGLQQPRYGIGVSSALGPFSKTGVQSRRNYISSI
jgi:hypothetical protein